MGGDVKDYQEHGGMKGMGESLDRGHAMIFSLWDDVEVNMLWLDSAYPLDRPVTDPGIKRGDCPGGETSTPTYLREKYPNGGVVFKNAAVGEIGRTFFQPPTNKPTPKPTTVREGASRTTTRIVSRSYIPMNSNLVILCGCRMVRNRTASRCGVTALTAAAVVAGVLCAPRKLTTPLVTIGRQIIRSKMVLIAPPIQFA